MYQQCDDYKVDKPSFLLSWQVFMVRNSFFLFEPDNNLNEMKFTVQKRLEIGRIKNLYNKFTLLWISILIGFGVNVDELRTYITMKAFIIIQVFDCPNEAIENSYNCIIIELLSGSEKPWLRYIKL